jgi:DNA-binding beta-propeller fold protein YncE
MFHQHVCKWIIALALLLSVAFGSALATASPGAADDGELWITSQGTSTEYIVNFMGERIAQFSFPADAGPHLTTFHSPQIAYVGGMGDGNLYVIDANERQIIQTLSLAPRLAHQAKPSPDGAVLLVSVVSTKRVFKIAADEQARTWIVVGSLDLGTPTGKGPVCTVFRSDGQRAYVSLMPSGIAIVDVPSLTLLGTLATDGFIACGMIKTADGHSIVIASSGSGGHIYNLDLSNDTLTDRGTLGDADWHSFNMNADGTRGFGTSPLSDELVVIDLTTQPVTMLRMLLLQPRPGIGNNQPDALGGGEPVLNDKLPVTLRAAGQLALINLADLAVKFVPISPPTPFDPMTCAGCAIHGVTVRPRVPSGR